MQKSSKNNDFSFLTEVQPQGGGNSRKSSYGVLINIVVFIPTDDFNWQTIVNRKKLDLKRDYFDLTKTDGTDFSQSCEQNFIVGLYKSEEIKNFKIVRRSNSRQKNMIEHWSLYYNELESLNGREYINASVIDSFMVAQKSTSTHWKNVDFFPLFFTIMILGEYRDVVRDNTFAGYEINMIFKNLVFVPYSFQKHYCVIVVDIARQEISHYDPFGQSARFQDVYLFLNYLKKCKEFYPSAKNNLCNIEWNVIEPFNNRPLQEDTWNCGTFIMFLMSSIAERSLDHNSTFNPNIYRHIVKSFLMKKSSFLLEKICLNCAKTDIPLILQCISCGRWVHEKCIPIIFVDGNICRLCYKVK